MVDFSKLPFFLDKEGNPAFIIVVGEDCPSVDIIFASSVATKIGMSSDEYLDVEIVDVIKLDEEVSEEDKKQHNMILVGTPESNTIIQDLLQLGVQPNFEQGEKDTEDAHYMFFIDPWGYNTHVLVITKFSVQEAVPPPKE
jgi:hypothetical protein